jgi:hypothetical protein
MLKNACGAWVGDIWSLDNGSNHYLLLEYKCTVEDEDVFRAIHLQNGTRDDVFFNHRFRMGWEFVA